MIDFIDIENTSLPPFCVIFGRKVEVVEEAGQSLPNETPRFPTMNRTGLDARPRQQGLGTRTIRIEPRNVGLVSRGAEGETSLFLFIAESKAPRK